MSMTKKETAEVESLRREPSYTLAEIEAAYRKEFYTDDRSRQDYNLRLLFSCLQPAPKPKTPEQRVTVVAGTGGYFSVYKIDGEIVEDAKVVSALVAALKESEAQHG